MCNSLHIHFLFTQMYIFIHTFVSKFSYWGSDGKIRKKCGKKFLQKIVKFFIIKFWFTQTCIFIHVFARIKIFGVPDYFLGYNFFYHKLSAKYFHIKQFFRQKQHFLRKLQKNVLRANLTTFYRKGRVLHQTLIYPFLLPIK